MRATTFPLVCLGWICLGWLAAAAPAWAGGPLEDARAKQMMAQARVYFGVGDDSCDTASTSDEIVICGKKKRSPRIDPPEPTARTDSKMVGLGSPPIPIRPGVTMKGCFLQKCPKELYFIDFSKLPEAPAGSDADKIAKGEMRDH